MHYLDVKYLLKVSNYMGYVHPSEIRYDENVITSFLSSRFCTHTITHHWVGGPPTYVTYSTDLCDLASLNFVRRG